MAEILGPRILWEPFTSPADRDIKIISDFSSIKRLFCVEKNTRSLTATTYHSIPNKVRS